MKHRNHVLIDSNGMLRTESGLHLATPIDGALGEIGSFAEADVLILRLYRKTDHRHGRAAPGRDEISPETAHQFLIDQPTARQMMEVLQEYLDTTSGSGRARQ